MNTSMQSLLRSVLGLALLGAALSPAPAQARVFVGIAVPLPYVAPPPVYYAPPPVYYAPPPGYYAPPAAGYGAPLSSRCNAGSYACPLYQPKVVGDACHCPAGSGWAAGVVG